LGFLAKNLLAGLVGKQESEIANALKSAIV